MTQEEAEAEAFGGDIGGPGPEAWANGVAALAAALIREAQGLAQTAAALRTACAPVPGDPGGSPVSDIRRQRAALAASAEAAMRATLALEAADALAHGGDAAAQAARIADAARRAGLPPAIAAPLLRGAALDFRADDAAARIAATAIAQDIAARLERA
jgi:hypothetical protein